MGLLIGYAILAIVACIAVLSSPKDAVSVEGAGDDIYVIDGDTLDVSGTRVRLYGIDAPEMGQSQGPLARKALHHLILGHSLKVYTVTTDKYGRLVGRVIRDDGEDLSRLMVLHGFALASTRYTRAYASAQRVAKRTGAGIWRVATIQNGADYRKARS